MIRLGAKKEEYREIKEYWTNRLFDKEGHRIKFDEVHFKNGYGKDIPVLKLEWKGIGVKNFAGKLCYAIKLGEILS